MEETRTCSSPEHKVSSSTCVGILGLGSRKDAITTHKMAPNCWCHPRSVIGNSMPTGQPFCDCYHGNLAIPLALFSVCLWTFLLEWLRLSSHALFDCMHKYFRRAERWISIEFGTRPVHCLICFFFVMNFLIHKAFLYIVWILKTANIWHIDMSKYLDAHAYAYIRQRVCVNVHIYFVFAFVHIQIYMS